MTLWVKFEDKDALFWLQRMMENMIERADNDPVRYHDHYQNIVTSAKSLNDYFTSVQVAEQVEAKPAKKRKTRSSDEVRAEKLQALCKTHQGYKARQRPRTDCDECWEAYKKFNPLTYDKARRDFERNQK